MIQFFQQIINGLALGSIYALVALGYTMVYGVLKFINFAHGEIFMIGTYLGMWSITVLKLPLAGALVVSMILTALIGMLVERIAYRPVRQSSRITALISAIGVSILLQNIVLKLTDSKVYAFPKAFNNRVFQWAGLRISLMQLFIMLLAVSLMLLLQLLIHKTKIGRAMRAVAVDQEAAALMGINVNRVISLTFAIGSALAAAAGIMVGLYYISVDPFMGVAPGLKAFVAAVFGGIGIIPGAMIGGVIIGLIEALVSGFGSSLYKDAVVYLLMILVLLIKPSGLLGKSVKEKV